MFHRFHLPILPSQCWMSLRRSLSSFATAYTAAPGKEHLESPPSFCLFLEGALLSFRAAHPRMDSAAAALFGVVGKDTASKLMTSDGTATGSFLHSYTRSTNCIYDHHSPTLNKPKSMSIYDLKDELN